MYRIGFDIGGTNISAEVFDGAMNVAVRKSLPYPKGASGEALADFLAEMTGDLARELGGELELFEFMGLAVPGSVDPAGEILIHAPNLGLQNVPLRKHVQDRFPDIPVHMENDAYAALLAEYHLGALKGCKTGILLTLGTGVGSGLILGGVPFLGGLGHGSEVGHMTLSYKGEACNCGSFGCLETLCSAGWLIRAGQETLQEDKNSLLFEKTQGLAEKMTAKIVIDCAKGGDPAAEKIFRDYVDQLSAAIISLVNLLDPEIVVLGGGVSQSGDFLFEPLRKNVAEKSFFRYPYPIVPAQTGSFAGTAGAALLFQDKHL